MFTPAVMCQRPDNKIILSCPLSAVEADLECPFFNNETETKIHCILERVSTRVVVVVVVVQPDCLPMLVRMSWAVMEPKSHSLLPKHLPLHARKSHLRSSSSDKLYNSVFSSITGQVGAMLVKLTETAKTHSAAAQWLLQSVAPLWSTILISDDLDRVAS